MSPAQRPGGGGGGTGRMGAGGPDRKAVKAVVRELYNATDSVDVVLKHTHQLADWICQGERRD